MMTLTGTLPRLKKNRSFQLGKLTDKGTSVQLLKPEHALSQLQSVFDGVQMALRGERSWSTVRRPLSFKHTQQNSNGYCVRLVATSMRSWRQRKASKTLPITYYVQPEIFSPALPKHHRYPSPNYNPDDYWWNQYSELNLNQYSVGSPCRTVFVLSAARRLVLI